MWRLLLCHFQIVLLWLVPFMTSMVRCLWEKCQKGKTFDDTIGYEYSVVIVGWWKRVGKEVVNWPRGRWCRNVKVKKKANKVVTYIIANKGFEAGCGRI